MKRIYPIRISLAILAAATLTSCETSGQLLTGGLCTCMVAFGAAIVSSISLASENLKKELRP